MEGIPASFAAEAARRPSAVAIAIRTPAYEPDQFRPRSRPVRQIHASSAANSRRTNRNAFGRLRRCERKAHGHSQAKRRSPARWKVPARGSSLRPSFPDDASVFALQLKGKPLGFLRNEVGVTVGPFDQRDAVAENVFVESEPQDSLAVIEPVKIKVVNRQASALGTRGRGRR